MRHPILLGPAFAIALGGVASAAELEVKMLNRGSDGAVMTFEPSFLKVQPGDSVRFLAADKGHNVEMIEGMLPEGAKLVVGKMNEDVTVTFEKQGVYGLRCKPHYGMGMVAMIVVGAPGNADQAKAVSHPGKARTIFAGLFDKLSTSKTAGN